MNIREIEITKLVLEKLLKSNVSMSDVCILGMYDFHTQILKDELKGTHYSVRQTIYHKIDMPDRHVYVLKSLILLQGVQISTVDAFQGKQSEVVIINFV